MSILSFSFCHSLTIAASKSRLCLSISANGSFLEHESWDRGTGLLSHLSTISTVGIFQWQTFESEQFTEVGQIQRRSNRQRIANRCGTIMA
jgi:hypothetical protein